jgi:translation initiation factor 3 subunit L
MVQDFVVYFYRHIRERNTREIYSMYSHTFPTLSDRFFKGGAWPPAEAVAHLVDGDHVFLTLYRELHFRHAHAAGRPTLAQRAAAYANYRELFGVVLHSNLNIQLPNGWLWDMVDEFCYQAQAWLQARGKLAGRSAEDIAALAAADAEGVWAPDAVLATLEGLAAASGVREELASPAGAVALFESEGYSPHASNVLHMLGYFSLIGLARLRTVLGDPEGGLRALAPLNPHERRGLFATKIAMAAITMYYYSSFAYLAARRWLDAARCLNFILAYVARVKARHARGAAYDQILKKNEQMYALLAIAVALCPAAGQALDEAVASALREKHGEKGRAMASGDAGALEELFAYGCPKFASAAPPDWADAGANTNAAAFKAQLGAFMAVVEERRHLPALKALLSLYSSIPVAKLAALADMDEPTALAQLELLRRSTEVITWSGGDALAGAPERCADVEFEVRPTGEGGAAMVEAREAAPGAAGAAGGAGRGADFLARHVAKLDMIVADLDAAAPAAAAAAVGAAA